MIKVFHMPKNKMSFDWFCYNDETLEFWGGETFEEMLADEGLISSQENISAGLSRSEYQYSFEYNAFDDVKNMLITDRPELFI